MPAVVITQDRDSIERFTGAAYGKRMTFESA